MPTPAYTDAANVFTLNQTLKNTGGPTAAPEFHYEAYNGGTKLSEWLSGIDVANNGGGVDFVAVAKVDWPDPGDVADLIYIAHGGSGAPTVGIGVTPPDDSYRLQVTAQDDEVAMGGMVIRVGPSQTGHAFAVKSSAGTERLWVDKDYWWGGSNPGLAFAVGVKGDSTNQRSLALGRSDGSAIYGFEHNSNTLRFRYLTGAINIFQFGTDGSVYIYNDVTHDGSITLNNARDLILGTGTGTKIGTGTSQKLGFHNATPVAQQTVTGSRGGNAALADLLTKLAAKGLIADGTS